MQLQIMSSSVGVKALAPRHLDQQAGEGGHTLRFAHPTALVLGGGAVGVSEEGGTENFVVKLPIRVSSLRTQGPIPRDLNFGESWSNNFA